MFIAESSFYSSNLENYANEQRIHLPPLYTKFYCEPNHEKGIVIHIKTPKMESYTMQTTIADTGATIREFIRSKHIDDSNYYLMCPGGNVADDAFINRMGLKDGIAIVLVPKSTPTKEGAAIKGISSYRTLPTFVQAQPNNNDHAKKIATSTSIRGLGYRKRKTSLIL